MIVLKMGCQQWIEDYGSGISGYIYRVVKEESRTPRSAGKEFCETVVKLCGEGKQKRKKEQEEDKKRAEKRRQLASAEDAKEAKHKEADPFSKLPEDSKL